MTKLDLETIDYVAIRRLQCAYADCVNRRAWNEFGDIFLADAQVRIDTRTGAPLDLTGPEAVGSFIGQAIAHFDLFEFVILNTVVHLTDDASQGQSRSATARVYICEIRHEAATGRATNAFGLYQDRYEQHDGQWRIAHRLYQSLARTSDDLTILPTPRLL